MTKTQELIYSMLTTSTGSAMCDSGDAYGRHWEANQKKTIDDFEKEPLYWLELNGNDIDYTISVYQYMNELLDLDNICEEFNALPCEDWLGESAYGISETQDNYLKTMEEQGILEWQGDSWNTYNGESNLSQTLQGRNLTISGDDYILLQIHQGCDVRGGYTDAKLFRINDYLNPCGNLSVELDGVEYGNMYDGCTITDDNGNPIPEDKIQQVFDLLVNQYLI